MANDKTVFDDVNKVIADIKAKYAELIGDGSLSFNDVWLLVQLATADLVTIANEFNVSNDQKKALVLEALDEFIDQVITPIDIKQIPNFIEPIFDKGVKTLLMTLASSTIDFIVKLIFPEPTT